jgi:hypothetical protein
MMTGGEPLIPDIPPVNPAIKMVVHNYAWTGYPATFFAEHTPTIMVGQEQADLFNRDPMNLNYMKHALLAENLRTAMDFAYRTTKTDKVLIFDGATGGGKRQPVPGRSLEKGRTASEWPGGKDLDAQMAGAEKYQFGTPQSGGLKELRIIPKCIEVQRVGILKIWSYLRGSERKPSCLQS